GVDVSADAASRRSSAPPEAGRVTGSRLTRISNVPDNVSLELLRGYFYDGLGAGEGATIREALSLGLDATDGDVARELVRILCVSDIISLRTRGDTQDDPRPSIVPERVLTQDASFLGTLEAGLGAPV